MTEKKIRIRAQRPVMAYPGSTIQNTYSEDMSHGFLTWEIKDHDHFDVKFTELPNPKPFVTIEWKDDVNSTLAVASTYPRCSRFRIRSRDVLPQKDIVGLTSALRHDRGATEVTFKNDRQVDRNVISAGAAILARDDLRNPDVLMRLLRDYHSESNVDDVEWDAVRTQIDRYLQQTLEMDDAVRNTKWSLRRLQFDNTFTYGQGNDVNFEQLNGIVGVFGPNRSGKSSIVGTIMYALFNTTDRGSVKNLHVVNARHPYCYSKATVNVAGTNYVFERQTTKYENRRAVQYAGTALNVFKIDENGEAVDLAGEQRNDTEKTIRKLLGSAEDCFLTSVAAQDDVKLFINQGSSKRRKDLSRFLDLDVFDRMHDLAKFDVNVNKASLKNLPDRDWLKLESDNEEHLTRLSESLARKDARLVEIDDELATTRVQLASFNDFTPVTRSQVTSQQSLVDSLTSQVVNVETTLHSLIVEATKADAKSTQIETVVQEYDLEEMKTRLESYRALESSFDGIKYAYEKDADVLKSQERSLKILDEVPCGDSFPSCKFIKDAFKNKERIEQQRERVTRLVEKMQKAETALVDIRGEDLAGKVKKVEQLTDALSKSRLAASSRELQQHKLEASLSTLRAQLTTAQRRLDELRMALENEENVEVVTLRNRLDELQRESRGINGEKMAAASDIGRVKSDMYKANVDRTARDELLGLMKAHELIAQAFSRKGIPSLIVSSQLPLINAEVAQILNGIVDFTVELEQDDDSDSMEVYIDYGDSRRIIELGSGMEKTIAALAIRVALINVSSLPKTDMFIIDESFGPLDPASVEMCNRLLVSLKRYFKTIIVITHVEGVKDVADHVIDVVKVEKDARVVYK